MPQIIFSMYSISQRMETVQFIDILWCILALSAVVLILVEATERMLKPI